MEEKSHYNINFCCQWHFYKNAMEQHHMQVHTSYKLRESSLLYMTIIVYLLE
jgi:hypothetical protein